MVTNKAAALARFLKRKLESDADSNLDPRMVAQAVENAKASIQAESSEFKVKHVMNFEEPELDDESWWVKPKEERQGARRNVPRSKKWKRSSEERNHGQQRPERKWASYQRGNGKGTSVRKDAIGE